MDPSSSSSNTTNFNIMNITGSPNPNPVHDPLSSFLLTRNCTANPTHSISNPNYNLINQNNNPSSFPCSSSQPSPRASKKRTRASRRVPTTVIRTDAANFRSMVQQFTGFPSPPFTSFYDNINAPNLLTQPLLIPPPHFNAGLSSNSSFLRAVAANSNAASTAAAAAAAVNFGNYHTMFNVGSGSSNRFGDIGGLMGRTTSNSDRDREDRAQHDDDHDAREEKRRKSVFNSWNNIQ